MHKSNKELARLKYELELLRSSRPVRLVQFSKDLIRSPIGKKKQVLKSSTSLLHRVEVPGFEEFNYEPFYPGDIGKTNPLCFFTNINVAIIGEDSLAHKLFGPTCNTIGINDSLYGKFLKFDGIHIIAIDANKYDSRRHKNKILASPTSKVVIFYTSDAQRNDLDKDLSALTKSLYFIDARFNEKDSILKPFINISELNPVSNLQKSTFSVKVITDLDELNDLAPSNLTILDKSLIEAVDNSRSAMHIQKILEHIGNAYPTVYQSDEIIDWLPETVKPVGSTDANKVIESFKKEFALERYALACSREVILNYHSLRAATPLLHHMGISVDRSPEPPKISVIAASRRIDHIPHLLKQIGQQSIKPYEVILLLHGASDNDAASVKDTAKGSGYIKVISCDESMLFGEVLNKGLDNSSGDLITKMDDDDYYGPNHLADLYAAHLQSAADFVGKWNNWVYFADTNETISWMPEHANSYGSHLPGGTFLVKRSLLETLRFGLVRRAIDSELYRRAMARGATLYSTHRYNYVRVRGDDHTYNARDAEFRSRADGYVIKGKPKDILFC